MQKHSASTTWHGLGPIFNQSFEVWMTTRRMRTHSIPDSTKLLTAKNGHRGLGLTVRRGGNGELGGGFKSLGGFSFSIWSVFFQKILLLEFYVSDRDLLQSDRKQARPSSGIFPNFWLSIGKDAKRPKSEHLDMLIFSLQILMTPRFFMSKLLQGSYSPLAQW